MLAAAAAPTKRAVCGEPVKEMRRTRGSATNAAPTSAPNPCTMLNAPGGKPASLIKSARRLADSGDHSAGFSTTELPAASAGAHFQVANMNGAFHGVMMTAGPAGSRSTRLSVALDRQRRGSCARIKSA